MVHTVGSPWQVRDECGRRKYLNEGERSAFLTAADDFDPPSRALLYVLVYTGCRISEALALVPFQLDTDQLTITFRTLKRRRTVFRFVPVPPDLMHMLLALARPGAEQLWSLHRTTAWRLVKRAMGRAGIEGPMACCRGLRHGFGIRAASRSVPPNIIQRWMGHASLATTSIYLDAVGAEERAFAKRMW